MSTAHPLNRIRYAEKQVRRYQEDVEEWKQEHDGLVADRSEWEDLIAIANFVFGRITDLDEDLQKAFFTERIPYDRALGQRSRDLIGMWLLVSEKVADQVKRLQQAYDKVNGAEQFVENLASARAMVTPDDQFFSDQALVNLRDAAIKEHQEGSTEPLVENAS